MIYFLSVSKTIHVYSEYNTAAGKMEMAANAPVLAAELEKKLQAMDANIGSRKVAEGDAVQSLLELVTNYCQDHHSVLREFPEASTAANGDLVVCTNVIVVEGQFSDLLQLVYQLEQKSDLGKIASVYYALRKDRKSKDMALTATIYIQNIKKSEENETAPEN